MFSKINLSLMLITVLIGTILFIGLDSDPFSITPTLYKGRFRPVESVKDEEALLLFPAKKRHKEWLPLSVLESLENKTAFTDSTFQKIKNSKEKNEQGQLILDGYLEFKKSVAPSLPSLFQLKAEVFYLRYDLLSFAIALYFLSAILFLFPKTSWIASASFMLAFLFHTAILLLRVFILERPPVSNMQESVLFVPWVAVLISLFIKQRLFFMGASLLSGTLLVLAKVSFSGALLETAPAVLNSRFWLTIHVLMVVSSYAFFLLAGVLAHIHLILIKNKTLEPPISAAILKILYTGTFFLVAGTLLGGVWAQQSWGRFWDWDPKESWAFISISLYLVLIHLYRFGYIDKRGLSIGAILGLVVIGFTWYGVNYLLGTGLHSYGFGTGGAIWFILFCLMELIFLTYFCLNLNLTFAKGYLVKKFKK